MCPLSYFMLCICNNFSIEFEKQFVVFAYCSLCTMCHTLNFSDDIVIFNFMSYVAVYPRLHRALTSFIAIITFDLHITLFSLCCLSGKSRGRE